MAHPSRRDLRTIRKLLIYPKFQLLLLGINLGIFTIVTLLQWIFILNTLDNLRPAAGLSGMQVEYFRKYLDYQQSSFQTAMFVAFGLGLLVSGGLTLLLSHRISGPLVRLKNFFSSISNGADPIPELTFRDGDFLSEIPPVVNEALIKITKK